MKKSTVLVVLLHLAYWFSTPLSNLYFFNAHDLWNAGTNYQLFRAIYNVSTFTSIAVFYLFYCLLFPRFLYKPQLLKFATWSFITIAATTLIGMVITIIAVRNLQMARAIYNVLDGAGGYALMILTRSVTSAVAACIMKGFVTWFTEIRYREQLEKQNVATNLELLKAKINPRFLFNTLNNIDVLIEKDAATASVYLKKLSDILRFTLYESPFETIPLKKEIDYIKQYIDLQKIRTSNANFVKFNFSQAEDYVQIAPVLFIPFIENAFKYSTNKKIDEAIIITIITDVNSISFNCNNAYDEKESITDGGGLGLNIMKERLELLYPNRHWLEIKKTAERFIVDLKINLHDH